MEVHEALYTTRMMRRLHPDPIPLEAQARILDAAIRAPNGGNTQRWHFLAVDDHGGANIYPAIWSALLAARAEGVGGVITTVLRYEAQRVMTLLGVPAEEGWQMTAMLALGYPRGRWGVAANRRPVHEVSSRNRWGQGFGRPIPSPLWPGETSG